MKLLHNWWNQTFCKRIFRIDFVNHLYNSINHSLINQKEPIFIFLVYILVWRVFVNSWMMILFKMLSLMWVVAWSSSTFSVTICMAFTNLFKRVGKCYYWSKRPIGTPSSSNTKKINILIICVCSEIAVTELSLEPINSPSFLKVNSSKPISLINKMLCSMIFFPK